MACNVMMLLTHLSSTKYSALFRIKKNKQAEEMAWSTYLSSLPSTKYTEKSLALWAALSQNVT